MKRIITLLLIIVAFCVSLNAHEYPLCGKSTIALRLQRDEVRRNLEHTVVHLMPSRTLSQFRSDVFMPAREIVWKRHPDAHSDDHSLYWVKLVLMGNPMRVDDPNQYVYDIFVKRIDDNYSENYEHDGDDWVGYIHVMLNDDGSLADDHRFIVHPSRRRRPLPWLVDFLNKQLDDLVGRSFSEQSENGFRQREDAVAQKAPGYNSDHNVYEQMREARLAVAYAAQGVYDFLAQRFRDQRRPEMSMWHIPRHVDYIIVPTTNDEKVPLYVAAMYSKLVIENPQLRIIFSGGHGRLTPPSWHDGEAVRYKEIFMEYVDQSVVVDENIIAETDSTNTGENVHECDRIIHDVWGDTDTNEKVLMIVKTSTHQARAIATYQKQGSLRWKRIINWAPFHERLVALDDERLGETIVQMRLEMIRLTDPEYCRDFQIPVQIAQEMYACAVNEIPRLWEDYVRLRKACDFVRNTWLVCMSA